MNHVDLNIDPINLYAIAWLERHGNLQPTEKQIELVEQLIKYQLGITYNAICNN